MLLSLWQQFREPHMGCGDVPAARPLKQASAPHRAALAVLNGQLPPPRHALLQHLSTTDVMDH